jgi:peptidoglycan/xylan/chitin deacetylase (PgdA/CDA1 family)
MFHRVDDRSPDDQRSLPTMFVSRDYFARILRFVVRRYRVIGLEEALAVLEGRSAAAANSLLITFDDGYRDVFDHAVPQLERAGLPAVVFLPTAFVGAPGRIFWWDECHFLLYAACRDADRLRRVATALDDADVGRKLSALAELPSVEERRRRIEPTIRSLQGVVERRRRPLIEELWRESSASRGDLAACNAVVDWEGARRATGRGITLGSHTRTHLFVDCEPEAAVREEFAQSRREIEQRVGGPVRSLAFPGGRLIDEIDRWVADAGYACAFGTRRGVNRVDEPPMRLRRISVWNGTAAGSRGAFSEARLAFNLTVPL